MKIGEKFKIPAEYCGHKGEIVWISEDKKTVGIKCPHYHLIDPVTKKPWGFERIYADGKVIKMPIKKKDVVIMIDNPSPNL